MKGRTMSRRTRNVTGEENTYGGTQGETYYVGEDKQKELGVSMFTCPAEQDLSEKLHEYFLLPAHKDDSDRFALDLFIHYNVGVNKDNILCPKYMKQVFETYGIDVPKEIKDGKCPVCELESKLQDKSEKMKLTHTKEEKDAWWKDNVAPLRAYYGKSYSPEPNRYLAWVRPALNEMDEKDIQFFLMSTGVYKEGVLAKSRNRRNEVIDLADPDNPYILYFKRKGKDQIDTKYSGYGADAYKDDAGEFIPMYDSWFEDVPRYTDILNFKTYVEIKELMGVCVVSDSKKETNDNEVETFFENDLNKEKEEAPAPPSRRRRQIITPDEEPISTDGEAEGDDTSTEDRQKDVDEIKSRVAAKRGRRVSIEK